MKNTEIQAKYKVGQIAMYYDGMTDTHALLITGIKGEYYMVVNLSDVLMGSSHAIYEIEIKDVDEWTNKTYDNYYELRKSNTKVDYYVRTDLKF